MAEAEKAAAPAEPRRPGIELIIAELCEKFPHAKAHQILSMAKVEWEKKS